MRRDLFLGKDSRRIGKGERGTALQRRYPQSSREADLRGGEGVSSSIHGTIRPEMQTVL